MANREQPQNQRQKGRRKPIETTPDDDEAQSADQGQMGTEDERQQQGGRQTDVNRVNNVEDEEGEEDEDEKNGRGPRPM